LPKEEKKRKPLIVQVRTAPQIALTVGRTQQDVGEILVRPVGYQPPSLLASIQIELLQRMKSNFAKNKKDSQVLIALL